MTPSRSRSVRAGMSRDVVVVRDEHDRHSALPAKPVEQLEHLVAGDGVERAGRLVGEQEPRIVRERPRDRDPLPLASRENRRPRVDPMLEADLAQELPCAHVARSRRGRRPNIGICTFSAAVSVGRRL